MEAPAPPLVLDRTGFDALLDVLARRGYTLIGPTVRDRAVVYEEISGSEDLPRGVTDEQEGGTYRLAPDPDIRAPGPGGRAPANRA